MDRIKRKPNNFVKSVATKIIGFEPFWDRVVIIPDQVDEEIFKDEKTNGGIIIPKEVKEEKAQEEMEEKFQGTVFSTGKGDEENPVYVKEGDRVLYGKYAGTEVTINGTDMLVVRMRDIFGKITEEIPA